MHARHAAALGLGELQTQSALNQPFYGQIPLLEVASSELDTVKASLASRSAFEQAGIERPHALTRLQFTPMIGPGGDPMIQVSTREPIREPYLDLLVEVIWPQGRLVKGYMVLLDPPALGAPSVSRVAPERSPQTGRSPFVAAAEGAGASLPRAPTGAPAAGRAPDQVSERVMIEERVTASPGAGAEVVINVEIPPGASEIDFPLRYGPVPSGAGLAQIARRLTPPGATLEQTALALYRNSQDAFIDGDINQLRLGAELSIPTAAELFALDPQTAREQYRAALSGRPVARLPLTDVETRLTIATPARDEGLAVDGEIVDDTAVEVETAEIERSEVESIEIEPSVAVEPEPGPDPTRAALESELLLMREASEANRQEATELRTRVQVLEAQLDDIRRLLELRNEQLAQLAAGERRPPEAESEPVAAAEPEPMLGPQVGEAVVEVETDIKAQVQAGTESGAGNQPRASAPDVTSSPPREAGRDAGFNPLESLNSWLQRAQGLVMPALAIILIVLLIGLVLYRRREQAAGLGQGPAASVAAPPADASQDEVEALTLDQDWIPDWVPNAGTDRGSDRSAELRKAPGTLEAQALVAPADLAAASRMLEAPGAPEAPEAPAPLQTPEARAVPKASREPEVLEAPVVPPRPKLPGPREPSEAVVAMEPIEAGEPPERAEQDEELVLDLEEIEEMADLAEPVPRSPASNGETRSEREPSEVDARPDLDLAALSTMVAEAAVAEPGRAPARAVAEEPASFQTDEDADAELPAFPNLDELDRAPGAQPLAPDPAPADGEQALVAMPVANDLPNDLAWEPGDGDRRSPPSTTGHDASADWAEAAGEAWDDVGLKLDLARAYLDMDDPDAARTILVEVVAAGRDDQRREAETLLAGLGR